MSSGFTDKRTKKKAREYLHLAFREKIYLVIGGSMGAGDLEKLTRQFLKTRKVGEILYCSLWQ